MDIQIPLKRGTNIKLETMAEEKWIPITHEKLPDFCCVCGKVGHVAQECEEDKPDNKKGRKFGVWLRVTQNSKGFDRGLREERRGQLRGGRERGRGRGGESIREEETLSDPLSPRGIWANFKENAEKDSPISRVQAVVTDQKGKGVMDYEGTTENTSRKMTENQPSITSRTLDTNFEKTERQGRLMEDCAEVEQSKGFSRAIDGEKDPRVSIGAREKAESLTEGGPPSLKSGNLKLGPSEKAHLEIDKALRFSEEELGLTTKDIPPRNWWSQESSTEEVGINAGKPVVKPNDPNCRKWKRLARKDTGKSVNDGREDRLSGKKHNCLSGDRDDAGEKGKLNYSEYGGISVEAVEQPCWMP